MLAIFERIFDPDSGVSASARRLAESRAVPARLRHAGGPAQGEPYPAGVDAGGERLLGGAVAELAEDEIPRHDGAAIAELRGDGRAELAESHSGTRNADAARQRAANSWSLPNRPSNSAKNSSGSVSGMTGASSGS